MLELKEKNKDSFLQSLISAMLRAEEYMMNDI